jgi:hypothetical protein
MIFIITVELCYYGIRTEAKESGFSLNKNSVIMYLNETVTLKATTNSHTKVTWSSSDVKVATVKNGKITAKKTGSCVITAKTKDKVAKCKITVKKVETKSSIISSKKKQHKLYISYIKAFDQKNKKSMEKYKGIMYTESFSARTYFAFADIDGDGTDECIVQFSSNTSKSSTSIGAGGQAGRTEIYTIKNGKVKVVIEQNPVFCGDYPCIKIYKNSTLINFYTSGHSVREDRYYQYKNGNLSRKSKYSCSYIMGGQYYIDDMKTTKAKYEAFCDKMNNKKKGYSMYVYTSKNLNKFI